MHHLIALFAGCLLYPPPNDPCHEAREAQYAFLREHEARVLEWNDNGTVKSMELTGIFIPGGIESFKVGEPAPDFLRQIGPALLAVGTEELRVWSVATHAAKADPVERAASPDRTIRFTQFIRGREVHSASVNINLNIRTNEVTVVVADFMPDRGLYHEPRLTAAEARKRLEAELREIPYQEWNPRFEESPPRLAYSFEQLQSGRVLGGALVWVFAAEFPPAGGEGQFGNVMADAATGKITPRDNAMRYWER